ncbi:MAG: hypothetical protein WBD51_13155, partial [Burkholderiaceae bacterium]
MQRHEKNRPQSPAFRHLSSALVASLTAISLAACGGGNTAVSGPAPTPPPTPTPPRLEDPQTPAPGSAPALYSVSGSMSLSETNTLDSDTNDPFQVGRVSNNSLSTAQELISPTTTMGYLNMPTEGPEGPNFADGDMFDRYKVSLQAGQVVEVEFSAEPSEIDVDLFIYEDRADSDPNSEPVRVGSSQGVSSSECVRITRDGNYRVSVSLYQPTSKGGTVYLMRIGAPGTGSSCSIETNLLDYAIPGQVFAQTTDGGSALTVKSGHAPIVLKGALGGGRSSVLKVPLTLPIWSRSGARVQTKGTDPEQRLLGIGSPEDKPVQVLEIERTLMYAKMLSHTPGY